MAYLVGKNAHTITKSEFTASAGQTSVSFISDLNVEQLAVYKNGVRLDKSDYTATTNLVTFTAPLTGGDEIIIESISKAVDAGGGMGLKMPAPPTVGSFSVGDIVWNSEPASTEYIGWVCTVAGEPGTWKGFGVIA